jgi:hypothetical protein
VRHAEEMKEILQAAGRVPDGVKQPHSGFHSQVWSVLSAERNDSPLDLIILLTD